MHENISYLSDIPDDVNVLGREVLALLRSNRGDRHRPLNHAEQKLLDELGLLAIDLIDRRPETARLIGKLGPNEEAFCLVIAKIDGAALRVHYYDAAGAGHPAPEDLTRLDVTRYGTPHSHLGDISGVIMAGGITHHCFSEVPGNDYVAGHIRYISNRNPKDGYKYDNSVFTLTKMTGLACTGSAPYGPDRGYWMPHQQVHVVSWSEPTVTAFLNDIREQGTSMVYQLTGQAAWERPRQLPIQAREAIRHALLSRLSSKPRNPRCSGDETLPTLLH